MRDDYALRAFRAIAEHGSFTRAAAVLDVTASALSQTLRQLETQLGTRLLHRTTRRVGLSEAGQELLQRIAPALNELDAAMDALRQHGDRPAGLLRLTVPDVVAIALLDPLLGEFMARWPDVKLDIHVDNGLSDLIAEGFDAGIRLGERLQRDMVAVPVSGPMRSVVVGSPDYFARHGRPQQPRELDAHDCVNFRQISSRAIYRWEFAHKSGPRKGQWFEIAVNGRLTVNSIPLAVRARSKARGWPPCWNHSRVWRWPTAGWKACWATGCRPTTASTSTTPAASRCRRSCACSSTSCASVDRRPRWCKPHHAPAA